MAKSGEVVLSATERMLVEKQKAEIRRMRMSKEQLELFRSEVEIFPDCFLAQSSLSCLTEILSSYSTRTGTEQLTRRNVCNNLSL